jgi:hypothetical protein
MRRERTVNHSSSLRIVVPDAICVWYGPTLSSFRKTLREWRSTRIRSTPAALIGHVQAPDAERAIKEVIAKYEISSPHEQACLAAQRVKKVRP